VVNPAYESATAQARNNEIFRELTPELKAYYDKLRKQIASL